MGPKDRIPGVTFLVPYAIREPPKTRATEGGLVQPTDGLQQNYNRIVRAARAPCESPFGLVKRRFSILQGPFGEDTEQLDCLMTFAFGLENEIRTQ